MDVEAELDRLAERVGRERFDAACEWAMRTSDAYDPAEWADGLDDVPHDLDGSWYDGPYSAGDSLRLAFALLRAMPCYHFLSEIFTHADRLKARDRRWMWDEPIYEGLLGSAFDVFGDIDLAEAREILGRLPVPPDAPGLNELREKLYAQPADDKRTKRKQKRAERRGRR